MSAKNTINVCALIDNTAYIALNGYAWKAGSLIGQEPSLGQG